MIGCLDPQQIIRGIQGMDTLFFMPPYWLAYGKEFALILEEFLPYSWFPLLQVFLLSIPEGCRWDAAGAFCSQPWAVLGDPTAQVDSAGEEHFLGHGDWKGNQNSS